MVSAFSLTRKKKWNHSRTKVEDNGNYLVHEYGTQFSSLGDNDWEMLARLITKKLIFILRTRAKLLSTDFFYANNFNKIELRDITLIVVKCH